MNRLIHFLSRMPSEGIDYVALAVIWMLGCLVFLVLAGCATPTQQQLPASTATATGALNRVESSQDTIASQPTGILSPSAPVKADQVGQSNPGVAAGSGNFLGALLVGAGLVITLVLICLAYKGITSPISAVLTLVATAVKTVPSEASSTITDWLSKNMPAWLKEWFDNWLKSKGLKV